MSADLIPTRLLDRARRHPDVVAWWVPSDAGWTPVPWAGVVDLARRVGRALIAWGLQPGERVAILADNRAEWVATAHGAMLAGCVPVGIYSTCSAEEVGYILHHARAKVVVVEDDAQLAKVHAERDAAPAVQRVVRMTEGRPGEVLPWADLLAAGDEVGEEALDARTAGLTPEDLATLIYTSGTTGPPKGVMLSHDNLAATAAVAVRMVGAGPDDRMISYLPLAHIAEQMFTIHAPATSGTVIWFSRGLDRLPDDLLDARPTILFGVPRVWEKLHAKLTSALSAVGGPMGALIRAATAVTRRAWIEHRFQGREPRGLLALQVRAARPLLARICARAGLDAVRLGVSGAAPIQPSILEWLAGLDLPIHEVYGQSEGSGPTSFNRPGRTRLGSVGPPVPGCEVRIADDGEILLRGRNVFVGYLDDEAATAQTLHDGWLHSGDLGTLDEDGFLWVTGRKKEILITSGGKNVAPAAIEAALKDLPLVSQAVLIGDGRKYLVALLSLDEEAAMAWCRAHGVGPASPLSQTPALRDAVDAAIASEVNPRFARVEQVKRFALLPEDLTVDNGALTPTMKVRRRVVGARYRDLIEELYADD